MGLGNRDQGMRAFMFPYSVPSVSLGALLRVTIRPSVTPDFSKGRAHRSGVPHQIGVCVTVILGAVHR
jgi:hypothetical protein